MTTTDLRAILVSSEFKSDLEETSSYLASIAQERPIIFCLAKHLRKRGHKFSLEDEKRDLSIGDKCLEFKFNYDCAMVKLKKELSSLHDKIVKGVQSDAEKGGWRVLYRIFKDVYAKRPDLFVWIICSRDLSKVPEDDLQYINWTPEQLKYNRRYSYNNREFLDVADQLLEVLKLFRPFSVTSEAIGTAGDFPSSYHFKIRDFSGAKNL
jgi:hypothetical protein